MKSRGPARARTGRAGRAPVASSSTWPLPQRDVSEADAPRYQYLLCSRAVLGRAGLLWRAPARGSPGGRAPGAPARAKGKCRAIRASWWRRSGGAHLHGQAQARGGLEQDGLGLREHRGDVGPGPGGHDGRLPLGVRHEAQRVAGARNAQQVAALAAHDVKPGARGAGFG
jgi:hypothetical protein